MLIGEGAAGLQAPFSPTLPASHAMPQEMYDLGNLAAICRSADGGLQPSLGSLVPVRASARWGWAVKLRTEQAAAFSGLVPEAISASICMCGAAYVPL